MLVSSNKAKYGQINKNRASLQAMIADDTSIGRATKVALVWLHKEPLLLISASVRTLCSQEIVLPVTDTPTHLNLSLHRRSKALDY